jgi:hypothetical protein
MPSLRILIRQHTALRRIVVAQQFLQRRFIGYSSSGTSSDCSSGVTRGGSAACARVHVAFSGGG